MIKKIFFIIFFVILGISSFPLEKIRVRVAEFAPCYFKNMDGSWQGLDVELAEAVIKKAGFDVEYIELPWSRAISELEIGDLDLLMNVSITDERKNIMDFIGPERYSQMGLVVKTENETLDIKTYEDLKKISSEKNIKFGIQYNVFYGKEFNSKLKDDNYIIHFENIAKAELNIRKLNANRIIGFFEDKTSLNYLIRNDTNYTGVAIHSFDAFPKEPVYFAITKQMGKNKYLKLKESFELLEKDGSLDKIRKKYN